MAPVESEKRLTSSQVARGASDLVRRVFAGEESVSREEIEELHELLEARSIGARLSDLVQVALEEILESAPVKDRPDDALSDEVQQRLGRAGMTFEPLAEPRQDPVVRSAMRYAKLVDSALSTKEAGERLGVKASRVRQLLQAPASVYGFKSEDGAWRLPAFQFEATGTVPGIRAVIQKLPRDLHPLEVSNWFHAPNSDLVVDDHSVSPLEWLRSGRSSDEVAELAGALDEPR